MNVNAHIYQRLKKVCRGKIFIDESLSKHTSFRIGGPADFYVYPLDLEDLSAVIDFCHREEIRRLVIGNGTNLLVHDAGFRGMIIDLSHAFRHLSCKRNTVTVGAGVSWKTLLNFCKERGLSGFEPLYGIPGQVGGCISINAGAYDAETTDRLGNVRLLDTNRTLETRLKKDIRSGYRFTNISSDSIIVEAQFLLDDGNPKEMEILQNNYMKQRRNTQPLSLPSAGSVFKRPVNNYAGRLIEESGCKGLRIGDAMVSKKHANFIVNCHVASAQDVVRLIEEVKQSVFKRFGIELELEIKLVGFSYN